MSQNKLLLAAFFAFLAFQFHVSHGWRYDVKRIPYECTQAPSSCGNILNISYPFRLKGDSPDCGDPIYELSCHNNQTILSLDSQTYLVKDIDYYNSTIRIADVGVQLGNCSSMPINSLSIFFYVTHIEYGGCYYAPYDFPRRLYDLAYVSCESPVNSSTYVDASPCIIQTNSTNNTRSYHYVVVGDFKNTDLKVNCAFDFLSYTFLDGNYNNYSYMDIHKKLVYGVEVSWATISCAACRGDGFCRLENNTIIQSCLSEGYCSKCNLRCE
ncbi:uncharacterized protein LOC120007396 [Tripterygium wilfordii]|uniref:uncharacterized protein LOC120007396 n=1 Tax=Tripterygium wilfordii TaxID=458696 RepID=UPI0018F80232|nr:uncharacterized protein LOC120007396 [Tripterygium wilfordii]